MRICPQCERETEDPYCPHDGFQTVDSSLYQEGEGEDPLVGTLFEERYRIEERMGGGGMGTVYRARQLSVDREVAIKILHSELVSDLKAVARFQQEARAVAGLKHPNVIGLYDFGQSGSLLYLVMEYVEGRTIDDVIEADAPMDVARVMRLTQRVLEALLEAHDAGIVHRDLKPENVLLTKVGRDEDFVKVLDFGVAKVTGGQQHGSTLTKTGMTVGTPAYMAPEQAMGQTVSPQTDLYALGIIVYEMLTGTHPFGDLSPGEMLIAQAREQPPPPSIEGKALEGPLVDWVMRCLAKKPEARFDSTDAARSELAQAERDPSRAVRERTEDPEAVGAEEPTAVGAPARSEEPDAAAAPASSGSRPGHGGAGSPGSLATGYDTETRRSRRKGSVEPGTGTRAVALPWWQRHRQLVQAGLGTAVGAALLAVIVAVFVPGEPGGSGPDNGAPRAERAGAAGTSSGAGDEGDPAGARASKGDEPGASGGPDASAAPDAGAASAEARGPRGDAAGAATDDASEGVEWRATVKSEPSGATVERDGEELGATPLEVAWSVDASPAELTLRKEGHQPAPIELGVSDDGETRRVELSAKTSPAEAASGTSEEAEATAKGGAGSDEPATRDEGAAEEPAPSPEPERTRRPEPEEPSPSGGSGREESSERAGERSGETKGRDEPGGGSGASSDEEDDGDEGSGGGGYELIE